MQMTTWRHDLDSALADLGKKAGTEQAVLLDFSAAPM
jgi:hypothetical protein